MSDEELAEVAGREAGLQLRALVLALLDQPAPNVLGAEARRIAMGLTCWPDELKRSLAEVDPQLAEVAVAYTLRVTLVVTLAAGLAADVIAQVDAQGATIAAQLREQLLGQDPRAPSS